MKLRYRLLSVMLALVLVVLAFPAGGITFEAHAYRSEVVRDHDTGVTLDYTALFERAYIISPDIALQDGGTVTFSYRAKATNESYDASRHFNSLQAAVEYHNSSKEPKADPVFYLAPGKYEGSRVTLPENATVLGNNAGISPNGYINFDLPNVTKGWDAADRHTETEVVCGFESAGDIVIDGIYYSGKDSVVNSVNTVGDARIIMQNSFIDGISGALFFSSNNSLDVSVGYDLVNTRITNTQTLSTFPENTAFLHTDGVYFYQNHSPFYYVENGVTPAEFSLDLYKTYFYKNSELPTYPINAKYSAGEHLSVINIDNMLWYESTSGDYGTMIFYTGETSLKSNYEVNIINSTFVADKSLNNTQNYTFLNGNQSMYQLGSYTINVNKNRIIGFNSMFPNIQGQAGTQKIHADFNDNYFAPKFTSVTDTLGTRSEYYNSSLAHGTTAFNNIDFARLDLLNYYTDYAMTQSDKTFYVNGSSFFDDVDYMSIDNTNHIITAGMRQGSTRSPELYFENSAVTSEFYSDKNCTTLCDGFSAPAEGKINTYYVKAVCGSVEVVITIQIYGKDALPRFKDSYADSTGTVKNTAYLLSSEATGSGDITATFDGKKYIFTSGENAFDTVEEIIAVSEGIPQIILPYGEYKSITVPASCEIYGDNRNSPVYTALESECVTGLAWLGGRSAEVGELIFTNTDHADVTVSGITLKNPVDIDKDTSLTVKNSEVHSFNTYQSTGDITLSGVSVTSDAPLISGALPCNVTVTDSMISNDNIVTDGSWTVERYDHPCSITLIGNRFENVKKTVISDTRTGSANGLDITYTVRSNSFFTSASATPVSLKTDAYSSISITENTFVCTENAGTPVYFDNTAVGNVTLSFNRFIGYERIDAATDKLPIDGSHNYFAAFTDDYTTAKNGTVAPGDVYCSDYYADFAMTDLRPSVTGFEFSEAVAVNGRTLSLTVSVDITDATADIIASCGITVTDTDGNPCDLSRLDSSFATTVYYISFYSPTAPLSKMDYTLILERAEVDGCRITGIYSNVAPVIKSDTGIYLLTLPESEDGAKLTVTTSGGTVDIPIISGIAEGQTSDYVITVTSDSGLARYRLRVYRPVSSGVVIDYEQAAQTAYIIGATVYNGNATFLFRGKTYIQEYDKARHFNTFDEAYAAYLKTDPDITTDTPVFIFAPGDYGDIRLRYRAVLLGANAGMTPSDPDVTASSASPYDIPDQQWSTLNRTRFLGSIVREDVNDELTQIESEKDVRIEFYTVVDGVYAVGSTPLLVGDDTRRHSIFIQSVLSEKTVDLYTGDFSGELTFKNVRSQTLSSAVNENTVIDNSVVTNLPSTLVGDVAVKNSFFVNATADTLLNVQNGSYTLRNSLFYNCGGIYVAEGAEGELSITNNIFTRSANSVFTGDSDRLTKDIDSNRFIGYNDVGLSNIGTNYLASNYYGESDVLGLRAGDDWYLDYRKTVRHTDLEIKRVTFGSTVNHAEITDTRITITLTEDIDDTIAFIPGADGVDITLTSDKTGKVTDRIIIENIMNGDTQYTLTETKNGVTVTKRVRFIHEAIPYFKDTDGIGEILNTASLIDPSVDMADSGEGLIREWRGQKYKFVIGQNLFDTVESLRAAKEGHLQAMLLAYDYDREYTLQPDMSIYGVNFDVDPNVKSDVLGDDWAKNPDWGKWGQTEILNITVPDTVTGTLIEIKGITLRGRIYDGLRGGSDQCTEFNMENIVIEHEYWMETIYGGTSHMYTITLTNSNSTNGENNIDRGMIKNMRVEKLRVNPEISVNRNRLLNERLPGEFTVDGLYMDMQKADCSLIGWMKMSSNQKNGKIVYKNCNLRNAINVNASLNLAFEGRDHAANPAGDTATLTVTNCTFYNMQAGTKSALQIALQAYSEINITNNLFLSTTTPSRDAFYFTDQSTLASCDLNIDRNRFIGTRSTISLSTGTGTVDLSGNYHASYTEDYKNGVSGKSMSGTKATCSYWYRDYDMNFRNTDITPYKFGNGMVLDRENKTLTLVRDTTDGYTLTLPNYIVSNPAGHKVSVTGQSSISAIPLNPGKNTFTVTVGSDTLTLTVTIGDAREELAKALKEAKAIIDSDSFEMYTPSSQMSVSSSYNDSLLTYQNSSSSNAVLVNALESLLKAIDEMEVNGDELNAVINRVPSNSDSKYSEKSYTALTDAINRAKADKSLTAGEMFAYIDEIEAAVDALLDISEYTAAYNAAVAKAKSGKYPERLCDLFYEKASSIDTEFETEADVVYALGQLEDAAALLHTDRIALSAAIARANSIDTENVSAISATKLISALSKANELPGDASQSDIDECVKELDAALFGLIDITDLNSALTIASSAENNGSFTDSEWQAFKDSIADIKDRAKNITTKEQAQALTNEVTLIVAALTTDTSALHKALEKADKIVTSNYTNATVTVFNAAKTSAKSINIGITQAEIDTITKALEDAMAALVDKTEIVDLIEELSRIGNSDNKYCKDTYSTFTKTLGSIRAKVDSYTENAQMQSAITSLENAKKALKTHSYTYKNNNDATCSSLATKTGTCSCGHKVTQDIPNSRVDHSFKNYVYNNDATYNSDGTKTAKCQWCSKTDTVTAAGTRLTMTIVDTSTIFKDVQNGKWYKNAIDYCYSYGFISGMQVDVFGINTPVTRGMFITILARIAGVDTSKNNVSTVFSDVQRGKYYTAAIKWGSENGVVNGMTKTTFQPDTPIQRQQLCVMIVNFASFMDVDLASSEKALKFSDQKDIGNYAKEAVKTAQMADIVNGYTEGTKTLFKPKNTATRAEAAQILYKFHNEFMK